MASIDPNLPLTTLLPIRAVVVTLECTGPSRPNFFHQPALHAFLRYLSGSADDFESTLRFDACESGRIRYQPGDLYRFMLLGVGASTENLAKVIAGLTQLPHSAQIEDHKVPFRGNWQLRSLVDAFTEDVVENVHDLAAFDDEALTREAIIWREQTALVWRWMTPARLYKDKADRAGVDGEARFCRDATDVSGALLLNRVHDSVASLIRNRGHHHGQHRGEPPPVLIERAHLFWLDVSYADESGKAKPMGGMAGLLKLRFDEPLSLAWWRLIALGQYLGLGQRTAFGWGRYNVETADEGFTYRRPLAAASVLATAADEENLVSAWRHVMAGGDAPLDSDAGDGWPTIDDEDDPDHELPEAPTARLRRDLERLQQGEYPAPDLRGYLTPKPDGGVRPLAVPPIYDRVLQRALSQILTPALDRLMYRHSYGYRRGHSRITASYAIQAAWRNGYRWVYESDIKDFFDSVNLDHLAERLQSLYYADPVIDAIIGWMRASVVFEGERIERRNGLPQGSPLSPLMANLMLDDFDSDMETAGFHLIRFADDFIVLCKSPEEAKAAAARAESSLAEHGFSLHPDKTRTAALDDGFRYLGYLFVNDMALDVSGARKPGMDNDAAVPPNSWLAQVAARDPMQLTRQDELEQLVAQLGQRKPVTVGERSRAGTFLNVTGAPAVISTANQRVRVQRANQVVHLQPWRSLEVLMLFGKHQVTTQAMHEAMRRRVAIHFSTGTGRYVGALWNGQGPRGHDLWLHQIAAFKNTDTALFCAREIVGARLRQLKETLRTRDKAWDAATIDQAIKVHGRAESLDQLRGHEGSATAEFFRRLAEILPPEWGFEGRNRRPPRDPVNVLLSIGYTVLFGYVDSSNRATGLFPWQGFYHQRHGGYAALASDLMEPFRHVVERQVLACISRNQLAPQDFTYSPAGACLIKDDARRRYLALLLRRFEQPSRARGADSAKPLLEHIHDQALSLRDFLEQGVVFRAWRTR